MTIMNRQSALILLTAAALAAGTWGAARFAAAQDQPSLESLAQRAAVLTREIALLRDQDHVENLQRIYGFYVDKGMWSEAADLFTEDATLEIAGHGVYVGRDRILELLRAQGEELPQPGRLYDQMQLQPIVHVAPDGRSAKGRWRLFAQEAVWQESDHWGVGVYENEYVKEDGTWKIQSFTLYVTMYTPYEEGWGENALPNPGTMRVLSPDRPSTGHEAYPAFSVAPFHYENPVTGGPVYSESPADHAAVPRTDASGLERQLAALDRALGLLEDREQIERLHSIYGYYLARNEWDNLAAIFSSDGSIEIAMRGVYVGPESVRRNLDLYGEQGIHHGLLHNHMQYQPVIHVAEDGQTARMRSRAFSMMGQFGAYAQWMGGVYENEFVKEDGIWKLRWDQVFNTYFTPYNVGWKNAVPRPPPGITDANPPDLPPSMPFEMYPGAFLPPYHYANPVTGNAVVWPPAEAP
jgi:hypothetical protein